MKLGRSIAKIFDYVPRQHAAQLVRDQKQIMIRSFEAVSMGRMTKDFREMSASIDADVASGGPRLRNRARQLFLNSSHARRYVDLFITNVIGETGHIFQSDIHIPVEDPKTKTVVMSSDEEKNMILEEAFADWSKAEHSSVTRTQSYAAMQNIAGRGKARDGEAFIRRVVDPESKYGLRLQIIPPEMIAESYTVNLDNGNAVLMGIEIDKWRRPVAYYVLKNTPVQNLWGIAGINGEMERIPASEVIHWYDPDFSNQTRGYTRMSAVMLLMSWMKEYNRANVLNAKFTARKLGFLSDLSPEDPADNLTSDTKDTTETESVQGNVATQTRPSISGEELTFTYIGNTKLEKWEPDYPHQQHEMFNRVSTRDIATALGLAYCSLSGDYSNSTWSSARTELDVERHNWMHEQQVMVDVVDMRVFSWWLELALMKGAIKGFRYSDFDRLNKPYFIGPRWDYINPVDESNALRSDLEAQIISPFDVAAKKGRKLEDIYRDIDEAHKLRMKFNIPDPVYGKSGITSTGLEPPPAKPAEIPGNENGKAKKNGVAVE